MLCFLMFSNQTKVKVHFDKTNKYYGDDLKKNDDVKKDALNFIYFYPHTLKAVTQFMYTYFIHTLYFCIQFL